MKFFSLTDSIAINLEHLVSIKESTPDSVCFNMANGHDLILLYVDLLCVKHNHSPLVNFSKVWIGIND